MNAKTSESRPRVALYARVSTSEQNPQLQTDELRQVALQRGWTVVGEFVDVGISGTKDRRPELDKMMQLVARGRVDIVACWRFDRFARSTRHLVVALEEFRTVGVDFISIRDSIDTTTPHGRFAFTLIAAVSALEIELIRERTIAGLQATRRRGTILGRPKVVFDLERAYQLRAEGQSIRMIARTLGIAAATVQRSLQAAQNTPPK